jgi:NAD-dependent SIR2 family protein deacetylase
MRWQSFRDDPAARQRYWARAFIGWPRFRNAAPNPAHHALAQLERLELVTGLVTQNVDALHEAAGSPSPVKLHGDLAWVICLSCGTRIERAEVQEKLGELNAGFEAELGSTRPDGDIEIPDQLTTNFRPLPCAACGGPLKPDVVFFGESIPAPTKERARLLVDASEDLLVVGSSLAVGSARALCRRASRLWIINLGPTSFDKTAHQKVETEAGAFLELVLREP